MKNIAKSVALVCVAVFMVCGNRCFAADEARTADESSAVAALEAMGTSVNAADKDQPITAAHFTKPVLRDAIAFMKKLSKLELINLQNSGTEGADLEVLKDLPGLRILWLDSQQLSEAGIANLRELPRLETLQLMGTGITNETIDALGQLPNLRALRLVDTTVTKAGFQHLSNFNKLSAFAINSLDWERSHPDEPQFSDDCIGALRSAPNLKSLNLGFGTNWKNYNALDTLAAAYAEAGEFKKGSSGKCARSLKKMRTS